MKFNTLLLALSLPPYLVFLWMLARARGVPRLVLTGFAMQLLFVAVSLASAVLLRRQGLTPFDAPFVHGLCESVMLAAGVLTALGFARASRRSETRPPSA